MANIKSMTAIQQKWTDRANVSTQAYTDGVTNPRADWATQSKAAEKNYTAGVQAAITRGGYGKGVARAGTAKWQQNAINKGSQRWAQGISASGDAYTKGFEPYRQVIAGLTLPARGARGDANNIQRVAAVAKALHDKKLAISGT